jgi:hypothetical protein
VFGLFNDLEQRLRRVLNGAVSGLVGGLLLVIGVGFLCGALWLFLSAHWGPTAAAAAIGCTVMVLGAVVIAAGSRARARPVEARGEDVTVSALVEAFIIGMNAGKATRAAPPKDPKD